MTNEKNLVLAFAVLTIILLLIASLMGIITDDGGQIYTFTSLRGEDVEIYGGHGLYQYDQILKAIQFRGIDWVNLIVVVPLFVLGIALLWRGQLRGKILLGGLFTYLAYFYLIGVMGNAFNIMFLVWTALYSLGLFGLALILKSIDVASFREKLKTNFPRKSLAVYMILFGLFLPILYIVEVISAYATATPPKSLGIYTTLELAALEIGLMAPLHLVGGIALWKQRAWGYIISILLAFIAGIAFIALSVGQLLFYGLFQGGSIVEVIQVIAFAMIATGFSLVIFTRIEN